MYLSDPTSASLAIESRRILNECLLHDAALAMPAALAEQASLIEFSPSIPPFMPTPMKLTESCSALWGCIGLWGDLLHRRRYNSPTPHRIDVDMYQATLMLFSLVLITFGGKGVGDPEVLGRSAYLDKGGILERYRGLATNIYKTKDDRYFHLHGSLDTTHMLNMLGLPQHRLDLASREDREAIKDIYRKAIGERDGASLEIEANSRWRQPGVICYTVDEFANTEHGKLSIKDPLYNIYKVHGDIAPAPWPKVSGVKRPLSGIKVLDLTKVVAGPTITRVLALMGADVLRISTSTQADAAFILYDGNLGKRDTDINLKTTAGKKLFEELLVGADVVVDGYRPGVLDRLGFGREWAQEIARRRGRGVVYCRENCYGWNGEWAGRSGYQQISDCVSGASWEQGKFFGLDEPVIPLLPNSDYQTGLVGGAAISHALYRRASEGGSYNVDISLTQFNNWYIRTIGLQTDNTQKSIRTMHPDLKPRHDTELFELIDLTAKTTRISHGHDKGQLWDPARWTSGPVRWGKEGEIASYLDWARIVTFRDADEAGSAPFGLEHGSSMPGSDKAVWQD